MVNLPQRRIAPEQWWWEVQSSDFCLRAGTLKWYAKNSRQKIRNVPVGPSPTGALNSQTATTTRAYGFRVQR